MTNCILIIFLFLLFIVLFSSANKNGYSSLSRYKRYCTTCSCCSPSKYQNMIEYKYENPCSYGIPILNHMKMPSYCSWYMKDSCPAQYWCHTGALPSTTACCPVTPGIVNVCELACEAGQGNANLQRWYFDKNSKSCQQFVYNGMKGNANNFLTKQHCDISCAVAQPCQQSSQTANRLSGYCTDTISSCNKDFYCHYGANAETTTCCPRTTASQPCHLPLSCGEGIYQLQRWYYDVFDNLCKNFIYFGLKGNENNFLTKSDCESKCLVNQRVNPCPVGNGSLPCSDLKACPSSFWCHFGSLEQENVCCPLITDINICDLPVNPGSGSASLKRWFYNKELGGCSEFIYLGVKGNANNFLSKSTCIGTCSTNWLNPCGFGKPYVNVNGKPQSCSESLPFCPSGYWCHVGDSEQNSVCCERIGDTCNLPMSTGIGTLSLNRWYFNSETQSCEEFVYFGIKGNENNFLTKEQCQLECLDSIEVENPCSEGSPPFNLITRQNIKCTEGLGCPLGYYCHVGSAPGHEVCCPTKQPVCQSALSIGRGNSTLLRWYFDVKTKSCSIFWYKGYKGNSNNFLSQEQCKNTCLENTLCAEGRQPYVDLESRNVMLCHTGQKRCPTTYFCNLGYDDASTVCCPKRGNVCQQPLLLGDGPGDLARWYYDKDFEQCRQFQYTGIGGNENNFLTEIECSQTCHSKDFSRYCPHGEPALDIAKSPKTCKSDKNCSQYYICHVNSALSVSICCPEPERFCLLPKEPGNCAESESRYGFEPANNTCTLFRYSGCGGNLNNFKTLETCTEICCSQIRRKRRR